MYLNNFLPAIGHTLYMSWPYSVVSWFFFPWDFLFPSAVYVISHYCSHFPLLFLFFPWYHWAFMVADFLEIFLCMWQNKSSSIPNIPTPVSSDVVLDFVLTNIVVVVVVFYWHLRPSYQLQEYFFFLSAVSWIIIINDEMQY